jgi:tight adherence protein C
MTHWRLLLALTFCLPPLVLALAWPTLMRQHRLALRLRALRAPAETEARLSLKGLIAAWVGRIGGAISRSGLIVGKTRLELEQTLARAGFRRSTALGLFIGSKLLSFTTGTLIGLVAGFHLPIAPLLRLLLVFGLAVGGLILPDIVITQIRKRHLAALERGLPDAIDLMVICTQSGLSLEPTIQRVAHEIAPAHPVVAEEFLRAAHELRLASDLRAALLAFGTRTGLAGLRRLTTTLVQTLQYGTPLSEALRVLAAEMRQEMLTRFEARAARLPVLLTVPMIVFILPCVFLVVGGPAIVQTLKVMGH